MPKAQVPTKEQLDWHREKIDLSVSLGLDEAGVMIPEMGMCFLVDIPSKRFVVKAIPGMEMHEEYAAFTTLALKMLGYAPFPKAHEYCNLN